MTPEVTVVVVSWRQRELARACLESLAAQMTPHRLVFVDNASGDGTVEMVRSEFPHAQVIQNATNVGFAGAMAAVLDVIDTRYVALLNNDAEADPTWLTRSLEVLANREVAAVTSKMLLKGVARQGLQVINNTGVVLLSSMYGADRHLGYADDESDHEPVEVFGFAGGGAVVRTLAVKAIGGFDADYFMYYEDTDVSWRLRLAGWQIRYCPEAVVYHRHAASSDPASPSFAFYNERNRLLMVARNAPLDLACWVWWRFGVTTISLAIKRVTGRVVPDEAVFDPALRWHIAQSAARRLPRALGARLRSPWARRRREVVDHWRGLDSRPIGGAAAP